MSRFKAPVRLEYTVSAGKALSRFLAALVEGRIVGMRCPSCRKVYVPARGSCPACGVSLTEDVPVKDTGTLCTYCIVNVPFEGQTMKLPYVYAAVLLDGADIPILHLVDAPASDARMGMRVKAEWAPPEARKPSLESIRCFTPSGEADALFASYQEHV